MAKNELSGCGILFIILVMFLGFLMERTVPILLIAITAIILWTINKAANKRKKANKHKATESGNPMKISISLRPSEENCTAKNENGDDYWVPQGKSARVKGFDIGGMIYVGKGLASVSGTWTEPALIDPELEIADGEADCHIRYLDYWPRYYDSSREAKSAFFRWLATGRMDPQADIGYVFLYFYGLERRVLHDAKTSEQAKNEIPAIRNEIKRLLGIYTNSGSFRSYAGSLWGVLNTYDPEEYLFEHNPPPLFMNQEMNIEHKLGLAQCSAAGRPLPSEWAYAWLWGDSRLWLRMPAHRCPNEFKKLFISKYNKLYGPGMILPKNTTKLKINHVVASPSFGRSSSEYKKDYDLPDVSILTRPINKLKEIGEECCSELDGYSRAIGRDGNSDEKRDRTIHLPIIIWPEEKRQVLDRLLKNIPSGSDTYTTSFREMISLFPELPDSRRQSLLEIYRILEEMGLSMQPDIRYGGAIPSEQDKVVLFRLPEVQGKAGSKHIFMAASLTLRLAATVALADGNVSDAEKNFIKRELNSWTHLNEAEKARLNAAAELFLISPPSFTGLNKQIDKMDRKTRELLAEFITVVAQTDSIVEPKEIASLEKLYSRLKINVNNLYSRMHIAAAVEPVCVGEDKRNSSGYKIPDPQRGNTGLVLDPLKIAFLQRESERVSVILAEVFNTETEVGENTSKEVESLEHGAEKERSLMGLSVDDSAFLKLVMTRAQWLRPELEEIANDRKMPLDGTIEQINEKSYSLFNKPFFEGDDPILLNEEVVREVLK